MCVGCSPLGYRGRDRLITIAGFLPGHEFEVIIDPPWTEKAGGYFTRTVVRTDSTAAVIVDTVRTFRTIEGMVNSRTGLFAVPFRPLNVAPLIVSDGERSVEIDRTPAAGGGAATFRVRLRETERTREATFRYRPLRTPADSLRRLLTPLATSDSHMQAAARGAFDFPEFLPPVTVARFDDSGRLWIQREQFQPRDEWLILGRALEPVGRLAMPDRIELQGFAGGLVWVVQRDSLDVPRVLGLRPRPLG